jgi:hypothetical protein
MFETDNLKTATCSGYFFDGLIKSQKNMYQICVVFGSAQWDESR